MGKSKDDHKLKRSSPSSPRDEARSKRHKSKDDEKKHKSKKKHKSHKISKRHSDRDKKSSGKRKDKGHKHDKKSKVKFQELSNDDYFSKNNEFAMWLKEEKNVFFSDLSSESARSLFSEFVMEWNSQELEPQYYEGIATGPRTSHKWNIKQGPATAVVEDTTEISSLPKMREKTEADLGINSHVQAAVSM